MAHDITNLPGHIALGQQGEAGATEIEFDVSAWADLYPTGAGQVAASPGVSDGLWVTYTRQGETDVYPVSADDLDLTDDILTWTPGEAALDVDGQGTVVIHCTESGVEKRSVMAATIVATGHGAAEDPPEPLADYIAKWGAVDVAVTESEAGETATATVTQDADGTHFVLDLPTDMTKWAAVDIAITESEPGTAATASVTQDGTGTHLAMDFPTDMTKWAAVDITAEGLAAGLDPTAAVTQDGTGTHFALGVPKGDQGIQGDPRVHLGPSEPVGDEDIWIDSDGAATDILEAETVAWPMVRNGRWI
jgi:hypothetical protein